MASDLPNAAQDPGFFNGRFMIEIREWNWEFYLGPSPDGMPAEHRFQGGLNYSRWIQVSGRIRAPQAHRGKLVRVAISPFKSDRDFGPDGIDPVGWFYRNRLEGSPFELEASLLIPESAISPAITCLSTIWRYLDVWIADGEEVQTPVTAFSFAPAIHPNLADWAGPEMSDDFNSPPKTE